MVSEAFVMLIPHNSQVPYVCREWFRPLDKDFPRLVGTAYFSGSVSALTFMMSFPVFPSLFLRSAGGTNMV